MDLIFAPGWVSHREYAWQQPRVAEFYHRLATVSRLILFDKRGTGMSERLPADRPATLDGSEIEFIARGRHRPKGLPDEWELAEAVTPAG